MKTTWKILFIGNSFSDDTMEHTASILLSLGATAVSLGNLYIGGCSINRHVTHAANDLAWYEYRTNTGNGWSTVPNVSIRQALTEDVWDAVAVQSGTADGSRNTCERCYENLPVLTAYIRALCQSDVRIVFNMTWVGDSWNGHPEIVAHGGDQEAMYREVARIAREYVLPRVDAVSPAGTAIQNARAAGLSPLTRDGYHLSWGLGRYIAGLTFIGAATDLDIRQVTWCPEDVSKAQQMLAVRAAHDALKTPFAVTSHTVLSGDYVSDTTAGSANQTTFVSDGEWHTARVYYTLSAGGEEYSLRFADAIDSTFEDGSRSVCNELCGGWALKAVRVGLCTHSSVEEAVEPSSWTALTFGGESLKTVAAGERFESDPVALSASAGDVLCVELCYRGDKLPCHEELWIASFVQENGTFVPSAALPVPSFVGVKREAVRLSFLGDSITQGVGTTKNSYNHVAALTAKALGEGYACRNLGIGFARSHDAASDGAWMSKAKESDVVVLCLGVNDLMRGFTPDDIAENLRRITMLLRSRGIRVYVQTVPPFEYPAAVMPLWKQTNETIRTSLVCDGVFDTAFMADENGMPRYGGHPNDEGAALWAKRLTAYLKERLT